MNAVAPPMRFGPFELVACVGRGGMGEVFLARPPVRRGERPLVVIKRMHPWLMGDPSSAQMLADESRIAQRLDHPNIVRTFGAGVVDGSPYIEMEYLEGVTLGHFVTSSQKRYGRIPPSVALHVAAHVLDALDYVHARVGQDGQPLGLVHRDVCPQNVFLTLDGQIKLLDFGIAKARGNVAQTEAGVVKGRAGYLSPEQAFEREVTARSDLFSVGVVLWELLAGRRLYEGSSTAASIVKLISGVAPRLALVAPELDPELVAIVDRALAPEPAERFSSAASFRRSLDMHLSSRGLALSRERFRAFVESANASTCGALETIPSLETRRALAG